MKYNSLLFGSKREEPGFWKGKEGRILPEKIISWPDNFAVVAPISMAQN